jgi:pimeloyl-ACP methyl ester carboxylesterase
MPATIIRGVEINYEVVGSHGPWMALAPGGRHGLEVIRSLARRMADAGYRVVIFDRRNCGASDVSIEGEEGEFVVWADDLYALLAKLDALPAIVGGGSSGCRMSLLFALRHPEAVRALLLFRVTGGRFAAQRLAENYYGQFIRAAERGGMAAVCEMEHFRERIAVKPTNRDLLMAMDPRRFIAVMTRWRDQLLADADKPVIGATEEELGSIRVPVCIVPGNDNTHSGATGRLAHRLIPGSELHELTPGHIDVDLVPYEEWADEGELAAIFVDFLRRTVLTPASAGRHASQ